MDNVLSSGARARAVPAPLIGEVIPPGRNRARPEAPPAPKKSGRLRWGALLVGALGAGLLGFVGTSGVLILTRDRGPDPSALALSRLQQDIGTLRSGVDALKSTAEASKQDDAVRALKRSVDTLKAELEQARSANAAAFAQINAKVDKPDRDAAPKLADIAARLDKLDHDPSAKLGEITARLDRIEKQVSSPATTGSIATSPRPQGSASVQSVSAPVPDRTKQAQLGSYILRDVYDGIALVEGRNGGIREVTPGENLPGAGEVRSIERRGRAWIVVTSRGIIDDSTW